MRRPPPLRIGWVLGALACLAGCSGSPSTAGPVDTTPKGGSSSRWRVANVEVELETATGLTPDPKTPEELPRPADVAPRNPGQVGQAQASSGSGRLSRESIEQTLGDSEETLGQCAAEYTTFAARIMVAPNGSVTEARVTQSAPDDPRMRDCLTEALRRMRFQSSSGSVPLALSLAIEPRY